jgi:hypothetical protein
MMLGPVRAAISVAALAAFAFSGQAAVLPVQQGLTHAHAHPPTAGPTLYDVVAEGRGRAPSSYYQLIMDPWSEPTKFRSFATEPLGNTPSFNLYADGDAPAAMPHAGAVLPPLPHKDPPARSLPPMHSHLLSAGQYVLQVGTAKGASPIQNQVSAVPLPGAIWLFGTALLAFIGISSRHKL